ncbi:MAG TPA: serine/threonine-protein kinase, partial [Gemmatimonadaceae bacterium]|nr:serine/threonine-protein kinase [Gemmatimonadaceae bacterium]
MDEAPAERKVSHYEIIERIGVGGMGVVYKARDTRLGRVVALKFLPSHHASNPAARARLLAEARAASRLDHPNIGTVYEIAEAEDGKQFIAMAWYEGETLKARIRRERIAVPDAIILASQIGSALSAAHSAGIVHRDVKPANVIVTRPGTAKLLDFGVAKFISEDEAERHSAAGTVAYMSPEQTRDDTVDARTDIWSLGVLLYEMLAGHRPFRGETDDVIVSQIRNEIPVPLASLRGDVSAGFERVVERCLKKDPAERFQTADELCSLLRSINETSSADRTPLRWKPRWTILFAASVAVVLGLGTWAYATRSTVPKSTALSPPLRIIVLPFDDSVRGADAKYIAEGLSDDVRTTLSRMGQASVASYLSSLSYRGSSRPATQLAKETNSDALIEGFVRGIDTAPVVEVRLVDVRTGRVGWKRTFGSQSKGVSEVPENVAAAVAALLHIDRPASNGGKKARAYDLYLHGSYEELSGTPRTMVGRTSVDAMRRAQALYAQARAIDPDFGRARSKLATAHIFAATTYDTTRARMDQARLEAEAALRLDPLLSDPHEVLSAYWARM